MPEGRTQRFEPGGPLAGELRVPGDKSISHRAALLGAMSGGEIEVTGFLDAADTRSTLAAVAALGAEVLASGSGGARVDPGGPGRLPEGLAIRGVGLYGAGPAYIDVGNAGTLMRLLPGWLAGQPPGRRWRLDGDASIRRRPMDRIAEPLRLMGARIECEDGRYAPIAVESAPLTGIEYELPVASAQVKSCLLLAGLVADGPTTLREPGPTRDHTERMLAASGAEISSRGGTVTVRPAGAVEPPGRLEVPGDISSAAFPAVGATLIEGSDIALRRVGTNPTRTGCLDILQRMGASIERLDEEVAGGEPVSDLRVRHAPLAGTTIRGEEVPRAIDELPVLALAAACAEGRTVIADAAELRSKESDRIETVIAALGSLGVEVEPTADGMVIEGRGSAAGLRGGAVVDSGGDHRIAMLGAIAGLAVPGGVEVRGMDAGAISYPGFERDLCSLLA